MALTRGVADPARGGGTLTEMTIAVSWGSVRRIDMEPATCGDPDCQADHGMTGVSVPDDVVIRVAAGVEGAAALARAETFAGWPCDGAGDGRPDRRQAARIGTRPRLSAGSGAPLRPGGGRRQCRTEPG